MCLYTGSTNTTETEIQNPSTLLKLKYKPVISPKEEIRNMVLVYPGITLTKSIRGLVKNSYLFLIDFLKYFFDFN